MKPDHVITSGRWRALVTGIWCCSAFALAAQQAPAPPPAGTQPSTTAPAGRAGVAAVRRSRAASTARTARRGGSPTSARFRARRGGFTTTSGRTAGRRSR